MDNNFKQNLSGGAAVLAVTLNRKNVQISNFSKNSFEITNTGNKKIAQVVLDVTEALYPDTVFDPFGKAGDSATKPLTIDTKGNTGIVAPSNASYIGAGGKKGYEAIKLVFNENDKGGFQPGETIGFSVDMDANSAAGTKKKPLDAGSNPKWDVGGVSGAELIGSTFTVTFEDGSEVKGQLQGAKDQAGAQALAAQDSPDLSVSLSVNGLGAGGIGTYSSSKPKIVINGPAGETARIVLTKGFIQPINPYAKFLQEQLNVLSKADFPANNAVEFQTVDIKLTGGNQDISGRFNFSGVSEYNFVGEDKLPLGFVASVIDPKNKSLPLGSVTKPIYLEFDAQGTNPSSGSQVAPVITTARNVSIAENLQQVINIDATDANGDREGKGLEYSLSGGADQSDFKINADNGALSFVQAPDFEQPGDANRNNVYQVEVTVTDSQKLTDTQFLNITVEDVNEGKVGNDGGDNNSGASLLRIEAEDIAQVSGYRLEKNKVASGGQILSLVGKGGNETGQASFDFGGTSGNYNIVLGTFDENDGQARFEIAQNDSLIGDIALKQNLGSNAANGKSQIERTIATGVAIAKGDNFTIKGVEVGKEHARFDFISFERVAGSQNTGKKTEATPQIITVDDLTKTTAGSGTKIRLEAEDGDSLINYRAEKITAASANKALSFIGKGKNETGSVTFDFLGASDAYDLVLGTFDEIDGKASFSVELNDLETGRTREIASLDLKGNLGSNAANSKTFISPTVAFGVDLTPGDTITVNGFENGSEHARLDYIELVPSDI